MRKLKQILILFGIALLCVSCKTLPTTSFNPWQVITLPTESTFADIAFTDDHQHGWLVGNKAALFESKDGGDSWQEKRLDFGEEKVSFNGVSFVGNEGWITGKPSMLLHTSDGGESWSRIPLSPKLPGAPYSIIALGKNTAEMVTDLGAIYKTEDQGRTWKALVEGAVGVARNITRSENGSYIAVSAKGNFYSTWQPGQTEWTPHQRNSSRRVQNMGFGNDGRIWLLARGGLIQFTENDDVENWSEAQYPEAASNWGLLDMGYRTQSELWASGGSGNLLASFDDGTTWQKVKELENVASNFYKIVFVTPEQGFVLGERGVLLKYEPQPASA